jgi:hypothetical protein
MTDLTRPILALPSEVLFRVSVMRELVKTIKSAPLNNVGAGAAVERMNEVLEVLSDKASRAAGEIQHLRSAANDAQVNSDEAIALRTEFGGRSR